MIEIPFQTTYRVHVDTLGTIEIDMPNLEEIRRAGQLHGGFWARNAQTRATPAATGPEQWVYITELFPEFAGHIEIETETVVIGGSRPSPPVTLRGDALREAKWATAVREGVLMVIGYSCLMVAASQLLGSFEPQLAGAVYVMHVASTLCVHGWWDTKWHATMFDDRGSIGHPDRWHGLWGNLLSAVFFVGPACDLLCWLIRTWPTA